MQNKLNIQGSFVGFSFYDSTNLLPWGAKHSCENKSEKKSQFCYFRIVFSFHRNPLVLTLICAGFPSPPGCYFCESAKQHLPSNICQPGRLSIFGIFTGRNYSTENNRYRTNDADRYHRNLHLYRNSRRNWSLANKTLFQGEMGSF